MHNTLDFYSSTGRVYTENEVSIAAFGDDDTSPAHFFILTWLDDPAFAPRDMLGMETSVSGREVSGAVAEVLLQRDSVQIRVGESRTLDVGAQRLIARFQLDADAFARLSEQLEHICAGGGVALRRGPDL